MWWKVVFWRALGEGSSEGRSSTPLPLSSPLPPWPSHPEQFLPSWPGRPARSSQGGCCWGTVRACARFRLGCGARPAQQHWSCAVVGQRHAHHTRGARHCRFSATANEPGSGWGPVVSRRRTARGRDRGSDLVGVWGGPKGVWWRRGYPGGARAGRTARRSCADSNSGGGETGPRTVPKRRSVVDALGVWTGRRGRPMNSRRRKAPLARRDSSAKLPKGPHDDPEHVIHALDGDAEGAGLRGPNNAAARVCGSGREGEGRVRGRTSHVRRPCHRGATRVLLPLLPPLQLPSRRRGGSSYSRDEVVPLAAQDLLRLVLVQLLVDSERLRRDGGVLSAGHPHADHTAGRGRWGRRR